MLDGGLEKRFGRMGVRALWRRTVRLWIWVARRSRWRWRCRVLVVVECIAGQQGHRECRTARLADGYGLVLLLAFAVVCKGS